MCLASRRGANRVYETGVTRIVEWINDEQVRDASGTRWTVTEDALVSEDGHRRLTRVAAFLAFWFGWYAQFPDTRLVK